MTTTHQHTNDSTDKSIYNNGWEQGQEGLKGVKLAAKTVDEDPASCKRWISRK